MKRAWSSEINHRNRNKKCVYAVAATTGAAGGASATLAGSSAGAGAASLVCAGASRGGTGVGSSIFGAISSDLAVAGTVSFLGLGLKRSVTRAERRRATLSFDGRALRCQQCENINHHVTRLK